MTRDIEGQRIYQESLPKDYVFDLKHNPLKLKNHKLSSILLTSYLAWKKC